MAVDVGRARPWSNTGVWTSDLVAGLVALCLLIVVIATGLHAWHTFFGDPTIYLVYARNAAHGDLFSFNPHQFSSGSTSPLWTLVLAIPYLFGAGATGAKALALVATAGSVAVAAWATARVVRSRIAAALGTCFVAASVAFWGALLYESPLSVAAVAVSLALTARISSREPTTRQWWALATTWGVLPLTRPDAVIVIAAEAIAIGVCVRPRPPRSAFVALALAAVPAAAYYGYSLVTLGAPSVSTESRSFALSEAAHSWHGIHYSAQAFAYLHSIAAPLAIGLYGLLLLAARRSSRPIAVSGLLIVVCYLLVVTIVSPVTADVQRYLLPLGPVLAIGLATTFLEAARSLARRPLTAYDKGLVGLTAVGVFALALMLPNPIDRAIGASRLGLTLNTTVEQDAAAIVNRVEPRRATVLAYEVQVRYDLRPDLQLLALDGLTDGKIMPYLPTGNLLPFLRRYRPNVWIADDSVNYRPSLARSVLHVVYDEFKAHPRLSVLSVDGVRFVVVARNHSPVTARSAFWTMIVELKYARTHVRLESRRDPGTRGSATR